MRRDFPIWAVVCAAVLSVTSISAAQDNTKKASVASLVRTLGYGGAIHNFKNYVLRGDDKYRAASLTMFERANEILANLGKTPGLTANETVALTAITDIVNKYQAKLPTIEQLRKQSKSVEQIDAAVAVDDSSAIDAIATLRNGHRWSKIENLDFHIGYGSGIHNFKNFVLRADEEYRARAALGLSNVLLIVARYRASEGLTKTQAKALDDIESVVRAYEEALATVQELIGEGKTAQEIDAVVKVDDTPALNGLATLRE
ncbi:MAG: hypothetical protein H8E44_17465 [Planctomycetes bacterium]|nr:hypothetical protein [Planctomycetota bacterium]MBL7039730.1 hypothetical protein [Pirellulaceae bacterium]